MSNALEIPVGDEQEYHPKPRKKKKSRVLITVDGGVADFVAENCNGIEFDILDWDNVDNGDEPGVERPKKGERGALAKLAREAWRMHDRAHKEDGFRISKEESA